MASAEETMGRAELLAAAQRWLAIDPDPGTVAELQVLMDAGDWAELADRFSGRLQFGTAGLRAPMGAGPMRMNRVVVRQATAGLVDYLGVGATVVIGYDARHGSADFAQDAAGVVTAAGSHAVLLDHPLPTPVLAFAVRMLGADAGVMVTASHNPPADNGYKVYLGDGVQIIPPVDSAIAGAIHDAARRTIAVAPSGWETAGETVADRYVEAALGALQAIDGPRDLRWVYTPLHGVGRDVLMKVFERAGFPPPHLVAEQSEPDPDFPTVAFPNPEEPGALDLALAAARRIDADLVVANDPDADRLAVAVPDAANAGSSRSWRALTGNETGWLLADHVLRHTSGEERMVATTIVSSRLLAKMADDVGVDYVETLTGFKWLMHAALDRPDRRMVFSYEEALGYAIDEIVRDKDGITAALVFAELAAQAKAGGRAITSLLDDLARRYGLHTTRQVSIRAFGIGERLRADKPDRLASRQVVARHDLSTGDRDDLPRADVLVFELDGDVRVIVRPSGTEPKTKVYLEAVRPIGPDDDLAQTRLEAASELDALAAALVTELTPG